MICLALLIFKTIFFSSFKEFTKCCCWKRWGTL